MNECFQSISKTKQNKPKESPKMDPRTRVEPTARQATDSGRRLTDYNGRSESLDQVTSIA